MYQEDRSFALRAASGLWVYTPQVPLKTVHWQREPQLLRLVEETFCGVISQETHNRLLWLARPLDESWSKEIVMLCADNFSVEW